MAKLIIQKQDILDNFNLLRGQTKSLMIPVLKANAYGLGAQELFALLKDEGMLLAAVSRLEEALPLLGQRVEILVLSCGRSEDYARRIVETGVTTAVDQLEFARILSRLAQEAGVTVRVHLAVDTGMGRFGFMPDEADEMAKVFSLPALQVTGIFTHCYGAFLKDGSLEEQRIRFLTVCDQLEELGIPVPMRHMANSCAFLTDEKYHLDAVRIGSALSGRLPMKTLLPFKRVGRFEAEILAIRKLQKGSNIGYGGVCRLKKETRVAVVAAGSADGLLRTREPDLFRLVDQCRYLYHDLRYFWKKPVYWGRVSGTPVPMIGRLATTHSFFDVTGVPCREGDLITLDLAPLKVDASVERVYE